MKVFIQHSETRLFLKKPGDWVPDEKEALCFSGSIGAIQFCLANKSEDVIILLRFGDPRYDIELRPFPRGFPRPEEAK